MVPMSRLLTCDGTIASVTTAITIELESSRLKDLGTRISGMLRRKHYERWAWEASNKMSATFLHSPPDALGYIGDPEFQVVMTTYLGQPCPIMAPFVGRYFGKRATALDRYGANLSAASLPGQGSRVLHNTLQSLLQVMMKVVVESTRKRKQSTS